MKQRFLKIRESKLFKEFFESEKTGGLLLILATLVSLWIANSAHSEAYHHLWQYSLANKPLEYWINDGLMAIFFLLIGLELEREIYIGELSKIKDASLPIFAALGGMVVPALIYSFFNYGTATQAGVGIPMATDIAFAIGILSLLGNRVPVSLKIFLTALAVIDDLGAIIVIALNYTKSLSLSNLMIAFEIFGVLFVLNRLKIKNLIPYLIGGVAAWYFMLQSGVHATISGVILAFVIPFGDGSEKSPSYILQHLLHKPVAFIILPLFALANTAISLQVDSSIIKQSFAIGIMLALVIGKPLGISLFSYIAVKLGLGKLPADLQWKHLVSVSFLGGIGFTMSIFITILAFDEPYIINNSKFLILVSSLIASVLGLIWLNSTLRPAKHSG